MSVIYNPKGKAKEYCDLAINVYNGCDHGCRYCYVPSCMYKDYEQFKNSCARKNFFSRLEKEASFYIGKEVHLCFTCDPYQKLNDTLRHTTKVLEIFDKYKVIPRILTKGGLRSSVDFNLLKKTSGFYGVTLTCDNSEHSLHYEPNAALPDERLNVLKSAYRFGIKTWVSFEPVLFPEQVFNLFEKSKDFVDVFKVGKWNHSPEAKRINWKSFGNKILKLLKKSKKEFYIKKDLAIEI